MTLTLPRLAVVRLRVQAPLTAALVAGLAASLALAAAVPLVQGVAAAAGLRQALATLGTAGNVSLEQFGIADTQHFDAFESASGRRITERAGRYLVPAARYTASGRVLPQTVNGSDVTGDGNVPIQDQQYYEGLQDHVRLASGQFPADAKDGSAYLVSMSVDGARDYSLKPGDTICFRFAGAPARGIAGAGWCARLTGTWQPRSASDPYWGGTPPLHSLMYGRNSYFDMVSQLQRFLSPRAGQYYTVREGAIGPGDVTDVVAGMNELRGYFSVRSEGLFSTGLDSGLRDFSERQRVASFTAQVVAAALLAVSGYSVVFVAGHFLEAQAGVIAVLRARGWSRRRTWLLILVELGAMLLVAVPVGLAVAAGAAWLVGRLVFGTPSPLTTASTGPALEPVAAAVAAAAAILAALAFGAARRGVLEVRRSASRPAASPWWRWRNLDLVLGALAVPLLLEARFFGSGSVRGEGGQDAFGLFLPALGLGFLALAALRLLPAVAAAVRMAGRGVGADLAAWQLARSPSQHARLALLLSFAVAVGLFSSVYAATDTRNTLDRAAYASGADVRADFAGYNQAPPDVDAAIRGLPGVTASSKAFRGSGSPGRSNLEATVLGIDGAAFTDVAWTRSDLASTSLRTLSLQLVREDPDGLPIEAPAAALSLWTSSPPIDGELTAQVVDADGRACECRFGSLEAGGTRVLTAPLNFPRNPRFPLRLHSLTLAPTRPGDAAARGGGTLLLGDLRATVPGAAGNVLEDFAHPDGWWHESQGPVSDTAGLDITPGAVRAGSTPAATLAVNLFRGAVVLRPSPSDRPIPALLSSTTLAQLGVRLGEPFPMHVDAAVVQVVAVAAVDYFPTLYPRLEQFLVVPRDTLLGRLGHEHYSLAWPNEAWLKVAGDPSAIESRLSKYQTLTAIADRQALEREALADPLRVALRATLLIGFLAALAMAVVGFSLHFVTAAAARTAEYSVLRANGLPARTVGASLLLEEMAVVGFSVATGAVLAAVLAGTVLPSLQLGTAYRDLVPPTVVDVDPVSAGGAVLAVLATAAVVGLLTARRARAIDLVAELRSLG